MKSNKFLKKHISIFIFSIKNELFSCIFPSQKRYQETDRKNKKSRKVRKYQQKSIIKNEQWYQI